MFYIPLTYFFNMKEILFATTNPHKIQEANTIGQDHNIKFKQVQGNYPEIRDEDVSNIAKQAAQYAYKLMHKTIIVEDSGLYITSLNGFPGAYSATVYHKIGCHGIIKLLKNIQNRQAIFTSAIAYKDKNQLQIFEGNTIGTITLKPKGNTGFGYDPIFQPQGNQLTYAQDPELKNLTSHRRKAFDKLCNWLNKN